MSIALKKVSLKFNDVSAVDSLSVDIDDGELVSLLGPSGCGKSSTLFMLAGLYTPSSGEIYFNGKLVNRVEPEKREIGMVFQNYALYPHMTVLKNIMFPLKMKKMPKSLAEEQAVSIAKTVRIEHLLDRKPSQLSGGQQQRVAIARALVKKPSLLLLDEPLSNLDARLRLEMREEIKRLQQETGITTVFVTHDQEEAMSISNKIMVMNEGRLQQMSEPEEIYNHPANKFVASFLGNPPINMLDCEYKGDGAVRISGQDVVLELGTRLPESIKAGCKLSLGVRPENFIPDAAPSMPGLEMTVVMLERIGRDNLLNASVGGTAVRALVPSDFSAKKDDQVKLGINIGKAFLFDENGTSLSVSLGRGDHVE